MASRKLTDLTPDVQDKAEKIEMFCSVRGLDILIYCTLRTLEEQAKLYRQSRSWTIINRKIEELNRKGFDFLADILKNVGSQEGPHVTNAGPGESWHNYAMAFDGVPIVGGKARWQYETNKHLWALYGLAIRENGMFWAGDWKNFKEFPHAQARPEPNPLKVHSPEEIKEILTKNNLL